jgi:hypothetical protein
MRVLMIHGRSQGGKHADELKSIWLKTLEEGFRAAGVRTSLPSDVDFPYYADTLDRLAAAAQLPTSADVVAKGTGQNRAYEQFMQSALDDIRRSAGIDDAEVASRLEPGLPQAKGVQNWPWVQAIVRAIDDRLAHVSDFTIERFLRDVFIYVTHREVARQVNEIVEASLSAEPTIVVGHSLGTVVAYNVILKNRNKLRLKKFITVGSPLGIRAISSKLGVPENPAGKGNWYNAYDERDIVALNPLEAPYFPTEPPIVNSHRVKNATDNRHGIIGYLNDVEIAKQIAQALA